MNVRAWSLCAERLGKKADFVIGETSLGGSSNPPPGGIPKVGETDDVGPVEDASTVEDAEAGVLDRVDKALGRLGLTPGRTGRSLGPASVFTGSMALVKVGRSLGAELS